MKKAKDERFKLKILNRRFQNLRGQENVEQNRDKVNAYEE